MSYSSQDASVHDGAPVEFFLFTSPTTSYRYNDSDQDLTLAGNVFTSLNISRGYIEAGGSIVSPTTVDIEVPFDSEVAIDHGYLLSPEFLDVTIFRAHIGSDLSTDYKTIWKARAQVFSISGLMLKIQTQPKLVTNLSTAILNVFYQTMCNHRLYDERCGVNKATHTTTSTVTVVGTSAITVADDGVADGALTAGEARNSRTGESRLIMNNLVNVITLAQGFTDVIVGDTITMSKGCLHTSEECREKFANEDRYGGFRFVPRKDPV